MPKYKPTDDDMYSTKPCAICGCDVIDENQETCSELCEYQWESFKEDYEHFFYQQSVMEDYERRMDESMW